MEVHGYWDEGIDVSAGGHVSAIALTESSDFSTGVNPQLALMTFGEFSIVGKQSTWYWIKSISMYCPMGIKWDVFVVSQCF